MQLEIGGSNSSTIIFPAPIDLIKPFLDRRIRRTDVVQRSLPDQPSTPSEAN